MRIRIAIFADIHSNVFALQAVIDDAKRLGVGQMLNLGDTLYGPIAPKATYELLRRHRILSIRGNQDRQLCEAQQPELTANQTLQFIVDDLAEEPIHWLESLPFEYQLNEEIYLCHGSPTSDLEYLLENIATGSPCLRSDSEIIASLNGQTSKMILCGHTHIPRTVRIASGQIIVNPGSVGLPAYTDDQPNIHSMENYCPHASYAVAEKSNAGWIIHQIKVPYDHKSAAKMAGERHRKDWEHYLNTGRRL